MTGPRIPAAAGPEPLAETRATVPGPVDVLPSTSCTLAVVDGPAREGRVGPYVVTAVIEGRPLGPDVVLDVALFRVRGAGDAAAPAPVRLMTLSLGPGAVLASTIWSDEGAGATFPTYRLVARVLGEGPYRVSAGRVAVALHPPGGPARVPWGPVRLPGFPGPDGPPV